MPGLPDVVTDPVAQPELVAEEELVPDALGQPEGLGLPELPLLPLRLAQAEEV